MGLPDGVASGQALCSVPTPASLTLLRALRGADAELRPRAGARSLGLGAVGGSSTLSSGQAAELALGGRACVVSDGRPPGLSVASCFNLLPAPDPPSGLFSKGDESDPPRPLQPAEIYDVPQSQMLSQLSLGRDNGWSTACP